MGILDEVKAGTEATRGSLDEARALTLQAAEKATELEQSAASRGWTGPARCVESARDTLASVGSTIDAVMGAVALATTTLAEITAELSTDEIAGHLARVRDRLEAESVALGHAAEALGEARDAAGQADAESVVELIDDADKELDAGRAHLAATLVLADSESGAAVTWGAGTGVGASSASSPDRSSAGSSSTMETLPALGAGRPLRDIDDGESLRGATKVEVADAARRAGWTLRGRSRDGNGDVWVNPAKRGEQVIINDGYPGARDPLHGGPYVKVSRNGGRVRYPLSGE